MYNCYYNICFSEGVILCPTKTMMLGFYEDAEKCRFGTKPKGKEKPASDFYFEFIAKVAASHPASTGFLVNVFPESNSSEEVDPESM